ncbi:MAG TPA: molybdopterin cofactor-binding domain-containing protein, partial [Xanthobacteraceae bacterium]|nr:molybdopterin cofactor-binding domain-containing protein [Xanthobacteraceae bacterium]
AGATPGADDVYSPFKNGWVSPGVYLKGEHPVWARLPIPTGQEYAEAAGYGEDIRAELAADNPAHLVLDRQFDTQSADPMFLEPESGLAWYDTGGKTLELIAGTQSPYDTAESVAFLLGEADAAHKPARINTRFAYMGGGFGGRDHSPFPLYLALAAIFFPGRPVRLANNRYEQFQSGIKRHAFSMHTWMGVDRATGKIFAFAADHILHAGGLANFSPHVATTGANAALGIYYAPKVDITTVSLPSRAVTAGSMRGYGTLQTMTALEVLVDEMCTALPLDPIEFRRRNALKPGERILAGNRYSVSIRTPEILDKLEQHAIWRERAAEKARGREAGLLVGTGVACATKNYGTGADCSLAAVEIDPQGRIAIRTDCTEMGTALGTAVANRVANHLGGVADEVALAQVDAFAPLALVKSGDPYVIDQKAQDAAARNPRWVPEISSPTSASTGAPVGTHAAAEAARVIFRYGLWPAALDLWHIAPRDPRAAQSEAARWKDGQLTMPGLPPLALADIAARAHAKNGITGAMTHGFNRWAWSQADFKIDGQNWTADIDALALRRGAGNFTRLDRTNVKFPPTDFNRSGPTYTAQCGTLVRVEIARATGALRIAKAYSVLECGNVLVPQAVIGQAQGAFAMGVGHTFLETLPLYEDGPGNGKWNLGQYLVARGSDLPLRDLQIEVLPAVDTNEPPKGMAEVVGVPVVAALINAIFDATGHHFRSLPVTQQILKGVLT